MTTTAIDILGAVRQIVGRRSRITRDEMRAILAQLAAGGLDLRNAYVHGTLMWDQDRGQSTDAPLDSAGIERAATAWERACQHVCCISVAAAGLRDGCVRYDQPGSMAPSQHATLTFVSAAVLGGCDTVGYLRQHADRVLLVTGEPSSDPPQPAVPTRLECAHGHLWEADEVDRNERGQGRCPSCGEWWV